MMNKRQTNHYWLRLLWGIAGGISLILGIAGIFLPVLPTTPFILLTAFCWAQSSDRLHQWLLSHRRFGPMIRDWQERRAIPKKAKMLAFTMMSLSMLILFWRWWNSPLIVLAVVCSGICLATAIWMSRLPDCKR